MVRIVVAAVAILATMATSAFAQSSNGLGAAPQPRVVAPQAATVVKPGEGGGTVGSAPEADRAAPSSAAQQLNALLAGHVQTLGWPRSAPKPIASGVNHLSGRLDLPDGRSISLEPLSTDRRSPRAPSLLLTGGGGAILADGGMSYQIAQDGEMLKVSLTVLLPPDQFIDPPTFSLPLAGGEQTVQLPGGGRATVTIDGAHQLTPDEQARVDRMNGSPVSTGN